MDSLELIRVTQLPVIEERLYTMKAEIEKRTAESLSLVCTEETIQAVKTERAELKKLYNQLEEQRKAVKQAVLGPYNQFEQVYKECVSNALTAADVALKGKIDDVESDIKSRCEAGLREYFSELVSVNHVEWLGYERLGIKVDITSAKQKTPKKLREQIATFVTRVASDIEKISTMENTEEILAEYKISLNPVEAWGIVSDRHRRIEEERVEKEARQVVIEAEREAVAKVEAVVLAPPVEIKAEEEPVLACTFTVHATKPQLKKLKDFLIMEGIKYE